jgi:hypothetical protein
MGAVISWLSSLFGGIVAFFSAYIAKRVAIGLAIFASFIALNVALLSGILALFSGLSYAAPGWTSFVPCFIPSTVAVNFSLIASAYLLRWAHDYYMRGLQLQASVS